MNAIDLKKDLFDFIIPLYSFKFCDNNAFFRDYETLDYRMFYGNIKNLGGDYSEILRLRNLFLNKAKTKYNKDEYEAGRELCSEWQKKEKERIIKEKEMYNHKIEVGKHANDYEEYLQKKKGGK